MEKENATILEVAPGLATSPVPSFAVVQAWYSRIRGARRRHPPRRAGFGTETLGRWLPPALPHWANFESPSVWLHI